MSKEYTTKEVAEMLDETQARISQAATRGRLGAIKYRMRFLTKKDIKIIKEKIKPKYTHCFICGKLSDIKLCTPECITEMRRRNSADQRQRKKEALEKSGIHSVGRSDRFQAFGYNKDK